MIIFCDDSKYHGESHQPEIVRMLQKLICEFKPNNIRDILIKHNIANTNRADGRVLPIIVNNSHAFDVEFSDEWADKLLSENRSREAIHVAHHEFCHVHILNAVYQNLNILHGHEIGIEQKTKNDILFDKGFFLVGEYFAELNSFSTYIDVNTKILLNYYAKKADTMLNFFIQELPKCDNTNDICILYSVIHEDVDKLFYHVSHELAHYIASNKSNAKCELEVLRNKQGTKLNGWIDKVSESLFCVDMDRLQELQSDDYIEIGRSFMSIYTNYGIELINDSGNNITFVLRVD